MIRRLLPWLLPVACAAGALWLRMHWIENAAAAQHCLAGAGGLGCTLRALAIVAFNGPWLTAAVVLSALLALLWHRPWPAALAAAAGAVALALYTAEIGAFILLLGVLWLLRRQADDDARGTSPPAAR